MPPKRSTRSSTAGRKKSATVTSESEEERPLSFRELMRSIVTPAPEPHESDEEPTAAELGGRYRMRRARSTAPSSIVPSTARQESLSELKRKRNNTASGCKSKDAEDQLDSDSEPLSDRNNTAETETNDENEQTQASKSTSPVVIQTPTPSVPATAVAQTELRPYDLQAVTVDLAWVPEGRKRIEELEAEREALLLRVATAQAARSSAEAAKNAANTQRDHYATQYLQASEDKAKWQAQIRTAEERVKKTAADHDLEKTLRLAEVKKLSGVEASVRAKDEMIRTLGTALEEAEGKIKKLEGLNGAIRQLLDGASPSAAEGSTGVEKRGSDSELLQKVKRAKASWIQPAAP